MLSTRIVTAGLLFGAFYSALFYLSPTGWLCVVTLVAALAFWEWGGLMKQPPIIRALMGAGGVVICSVLSLMFPSALGVGQASAGNSWQLGQWFYLPATVFWLLLVPVWLKQRWNVSHPIVGCLTGLVVILPAWLALIQLRQVGAISLLAIMSVVWLADIAAYFSGRTWGRHKLAPAISPGKTWEGALGGLLAVVIYGFLLSSWLPDILANNYLLLFLMLLLLAAVSIVGDLFESLLKRQVGLKDSSNVLPGHGGILDRIDSLTSTLPLVALVWFGANH